MLTKLVQPAYIQLDVEAENFEQAIVLSMKPLVNEGAVTNAYVKEVVTILKDIGPYIVITKNIAIPHAPSDAGSNKAAIGFTRLKKPVVSGNSDNDPVKYLFSLSSPSGQEHISALSELVNLFSSEDFLGFIDEVKTSNDFIDFLENFEGSNKND